MIHELCRFVFYFISLMLLFGMAKAFLARIRRKHQHHKEEPFNGRQTEKTR